MNLNKFKNLGFTLLELILVLLVIGIISSLGIAMYAQRTANAKIEQTVNQMKLLQQAAVNYYIDNNCWPNATNCPRNPTNFQQYISLASLNNPWDGQYTFRIEPTYKKKYQVWSGILPYKAIAQVVARLPNSGIDPGVPDQVVQEIAIPAKQATPAPSNILIQALGITSFLCDYQYGTDCQGSFAFFMSCPKSYMAWTVTGPSRIEADTNGWLLEGNNIISQLLAGSTPTDYCTKQSSTPTQDNYSCTINVTANTESVVGANPFSRPRKNLGSTGQRFMYVGACVKF